MKLKEIYEQQLQQQASGESSSKINAGTSVSSVLRPSEGTGNPSKDVLSTAPGGASTSYSVTNENQSVLPTPPLEHQAQDFAMKLKEIYEQHLQQAPSDSSSKMNAGASVPSVLSPSEGTGNSSKEIPSTVPVGTVNNETGSAQTALENPPFGRDNHAFTSVLRPAAGDEATNGKALIGFLSSLRQSYEEALLDRRQDSSSQPKNGTGHVATPAPNSSEGGSGCTRLSDLASLIASTSQPKQEHKRAMPSHVTDTSSTHNQGESSQEDYSDWNSDKKTDPSSSEDSDKEVKMNRDPEIHANSGKGPPRKRLKISNNNAN